MEEGKGSCEAAFWEKSQAGKLVARCTILALVIGVLLGFAEAAQLYFYPRLPLLSPDVRWVIWLITPLVDLCLASLAGFVLGLMLALPFLSGTHRRVASLTTIVIGSISALCIVTLIGRVIAQIFKRGLHADAPLGTLIVLTVVLVFCCLQRKRIYRLIQGEFPRLFRRLAFALAMTIAALTGILAAYILGQWIPTSTVRAGTVPALDKPNIVLITLDTVRADHLSLYGYRRATTPYLDRWAQRGVVFENAIAPSSWTLASHASIMTGLLPHQHGADWASPVQGNPWPLAKILNTHGYASAGFSANLYFGYGGWGLNRGFDIYDDDSTSLRHNLNSTLVGQALLQPAYSTWFKPDRLDRRTAAQVNRDVLRWYQNKPPRPFFLFVNYFDAHEPFLAPSPYDRRFGGASHDLLKKAEEVTDGGASPQTLSPPEREALAASYDNCLAYLDSELNNLLTFLSSQPEWANTIVFITADHGESLGEHSNYGHGMDLSHVVLHVPLIVLGPGVPSGVRIENLVATRQLFATVLDLTLGGKQPFSRHSLRARWTPGMQGDSQHRVLISELLLRTDPRQDLLSLFTGRWHYLDDSNGHPALYDWTKDPEESVDLAAGQPAVVNELDGLLRAYEAKSVQPWRGPEYLAALGEGKDLASAAPALSDHIDPIGICQTIFSQNDDPPVPREIPDESLLRSIPYD